MSMPSHGSPAKSPCQPLEALPPLSKAAADAEATMRQNHYAVPAEAFGDESCLVQIYPADVVDGMLLLEQEVLTIGREIACDLSLEDSNVSRRHAEIHRSGPGHRVIDLGSTNGTILNGKYVGEAPLRSGDCLAIGSFIFKYLSAGSVESQYHETVYQSLTRDALTGAVNKRYLLESMQREIARSRRGGQPLTTVMIDIDHFKRINDHHGHLVGDEVLREFGHRLLRICREDDLLARYGGEEFTLVLAATDLGEATAIAERCRAAVADAPFTTQAGDLSITASFGGYCYNGTAPVKPEDLIDIGDEQLYRAKREGRNRVCMHRPNREIN